MLFRSEALDAVFLRELEYELARLTRKLLIHFDNDATSCYDRIACFLANVASRKYGMHRKVCIVQGKTLQHAKYHLKTKLGISEEYIMHSQEFPWFGTGQGSGNSPAVWLFICSTLFDIYETKATGATYESPDKTMTTTIHILGFVDDTRNSTNQFTSNHQPPMDTLIDIAIQDSQLWHDLLAVSNQALELPKCGYHAIQYSFEEDGTPALIPTPVTKPLELRDIHNQPLQIKQWPNTTAAKYLGNHKCPADQVKQKEVLTKNVKKFARVVNATHLMRREAHIYYHAIYRLSIGYPLPMSWFTFEELDKIQSPALAALLPKLGYNRHTAREVVYGPYFLGGACLFHLWDDQFYGQVRWFIKFWRTPDSDIGITLRITVAWAQFTVGTGTSILSDTSTNFPHFEAKWLKSLRNGLQRINGQIQLDTPFIAPKQRQDDQYLMDLALKFFPAKKKSAKLRRINYCRMYLNVLLLSDITTACGTKIDPAMYQGYPANTESTTDHHQVNQNRPNEKAWKDWRAFLHKLCGRTKDRRLIVPLKDWIVPAPQMRRQWKFYYHQPSDKLYRRTPNGFMLHKKIITDFDGDPSDFTQTLPNDAAPCSVRNTGTTFILVRPSQTILDPEPSAPRSIHDIIDSADTWEVHLLEHLELLVPDDHLMDCLSTQTCILVSDGSAPSPKASFAWILASPDGRRLARCSGPAFGYKASSYRAEGYGMLSGTRFLYHISNLLQTEPTPRNLQPVEFRCDNKSMIEVTVKHCKYQQVYPNATMASDWDIIAELRETIHQIPETSRPSYRHIKGHQDKDTSYEDLPLRAQLNVQADELADAWLHEHPDTEFTLVPVLPTSGCQLHIEGKGTITHNYKQELQQSRTVPALRHKMEHRYAWDHDTFDDINWTAHGRALRRLEKHKVTLVKYLHDHIPVGKLVNQYHPKYPAGCPSCPEPLETREHLLLCPEKHRQEWKQKCIKTVRQYLEKTNTALPLMTLLLEGIHSALYNRHSTTIPVPPEVTHIAEAQAAIGWNHALKGRFSTLWSEFHQAHLGTQATERNNGLSWLTGLIEVVLSQWLELWALRNGDRHGRDYRSKAQAERRLAIHALKILYDQYDGHVMPEHQWLFDAPFHVTQQWSTSHIIQFLNTFEPILKESYATRLETG